jgi:hypothetical protein
MARARPRLVGTMAAALLATAWLAAAPAAATRRSGPGVTVTAAKLPTTSWFGALEQVGGRLKLEGRAPTRIPDETGACVTADLDPITLRVGPARADAVCNVDIGSGQRVGYEETYTDNRNLIELSVVRLAAGRLVQGPVIMTYDECAGCGPESAYGGGWMWIYVAPPVGAPSVLQVSASTGQVVDTIGIPSAISQPVVAANAEGFWFWSSPESGWDGSPPGASLYRIAPGASAPVAITSGFRDLCWMVGQGTHLWVGTGPTGGGCGPQEVARYDGTDPTPVFTIADPYDPLAVVGGPEGLWTVLPNRQSNETRSLVIRIDPDTGRVVVVARSSTLVLAIGGESLMPGEAAAYRGSLYVLGLPDVGQGGFGELFRITPS